MIRPMQFVPVLAALLGACGGTQPAKTPAAAPVDTTPPPAQPAAQSPVTAENEALYDLYSEMLTKPAPAKKWQQFTDEVGCLVEWYGDARGTQLVEAATKKAIADHGGQPAEDKLEQALAGGGGETRACPKKKPQ